MRRGEFYGCTGFTGGFGGLNGLLADCGCEKSGGMFGVSFSVNLIIYWMHFLKVVCV